MNIVETILDGSARHGRRPAIIRDGHILEYENLRRKVCDAAAALGTASAGAARVAMPLANTVDDIVLALAVMLNGHTLIALPPNAMNHEKSAHLQCCMAEFLIGHGPRGPVFTPVDAAGDFPEAARQIAFIRPTSGTTGTSKGVMLSHECIAARIDSVIAAFGLSGHDTVIWTMAASHHFASSILAYLKAGATVALASNTAPSGVLELAHAHDATMLYGSPWQFKMLASASSNRTLPRLRWALSTGQALPAMTAGSFERRFGHPLRQAYGIIEAGLVCINTLGAPVCPNAVGPAAPGFTLRIVDESGRNLPDGETGEVCIKSPGLFSGYVVPEKNNHAIDMEGYFHSGDVGLTCDGCLFLKGRKASQLNVAGFKVFPEEIEAVLETHPAVMKARVHGYPDPRIGHIIVADVVINDDAALNAKELLGHCRNNMERYKSPLEIRFVPSIDETVTGKIKRS